MLALRYSIQPEPNTMNTFFKQQSGISQNQRGSKTLSKAGSGEMPSDYLLIRELINLGIPYERINIPGITFQTIEIKSQVLAL